MCNQEIFYIWIIFNHRVNFHFQIHFFIIMFHFECNILQHFIVKPLWGIITSQVLVCALNDLFNNRRLTGSYRHYHSLILEKENYTRIHHLKGCRQQKDRSEMASLLGFNINFLICSLTLCNIILPGFCATVLSMTICGIKVF